MASDAEPRYTTFSGKDPAAFVIAENLARRHLTPSQIAMVAERFVQYERAAAKERKWAGVPPCNIALRSDGAAGKSVEIVADRFGVGARNVFKAVRVRRDGARSDSKAVTNSNKTAIACRGKHRPRLRTRRCHHCYCARRETATNERCEISHTALSATTLDFVRVFL
jgi:hypothetical protein